MTNLMAIYGNICSFEPGTHLSEGARVKHPGGVECNSSVSPSHREVYNCQSHSTYRSVALEPPKTITVTWNWCPTHLKANWITSTSLPTISNLNCQGISMVPTLPEAGDRLFSPEAGSFEGGKWKRCWWIYFIFKWWWSVYWWMIFQSMHSRMYIAPCRSMIIDVSRLPFSRQEATLPEMPFASNVTDMFFIVLFPRTGILRAHSVLQSFPNLLHVVLTWTGGTFHVLHIITNLCRC